MEEITSNWPIKFLANQILCMICNNPPSTKSSEETQALLRFTDSAYPFGIFKLFSAILHKQRDIYSIYKCCLNVIGYKSLIRCSCVILLFLKRFFFISCGCLRFIEKTIQYYCFHQYIELICQQAMLYYTTTMNHNISEAIFVYYIVKEEIITSKLFIRPFMKSYSKINYIFWIFIVGLLSGNIDAKLERETQEEL